MRYINLPFNTFNILGSEDMNYYIFPSMNIVYSR